MARIAGTDGETDIILSFGGLFCKNGVLLSPGQHLLLAGVQSDPVITAVFKGLISLRDQKAFFRILEIIRHQPDLIVDLGARRRSQNGKLR